MISEEPEPTDYQRREHHRRHLLLHQMLDELIADWIANTRGHLSRTTVLELMQWSAKQCRGPDHPPKP